MPIHLMQLGRRFKIRGLQLQLLIFLVVPCRFVCCLDLKSFARSTLCIPANTLDANLPDLIAKNVTDKADDAVKKVGTDCGV